MRRSLPLALSPKPNGLVFPGKAVGKSDAWLHSMTDKCDPLARPADSCGLSRRSQEFPTVMRDHGIRFVVVEHLSGSRVDGAAFWLDERSPGIAVSLRLDRIDNFWFTLMHECSHIEHHDALSVDVEMGQEEVQPLVKEDAEKRADEEAAAVLVSPDELDSFIRRLGPIYAEPNIIQFAHRIKMHPAVIVGQLQHRSEIGFGSHRNLQPKIRAHVVSTA